MNRVLFCAMVCLGLFLCSCQKDTAGLSEREPLAAAKASAEKPVEEYTVRFIYIIPSDREFNREYYNAIKKTARTIQDWYADQLGGETFRLNTPIVEVLQSDYPAAWFNTANETSGTNPTYYFFYNTYNEARNLLGTEFDMSKYVYMLYVDAPGATGAGATGVATLPENDLKGLAGILEGSWVGGNAHELGHALGLPHPDGDPLYDQALMGTGYIKFPNSILLPSDQATLLNSAFIFAKKESTN